MAGRWDHAIGGYPASIEVILRFAVDRAAVRYIDEHCPKAWFRAIFALSDRTAPPDTDERTDT